MKKAKTILLALTLAAVLAVGIGFFVRYFNPNTKKVARFTLNYDGKVITDHADIVFPRETVKVTAKHVFAFAESDTSFAVKIVPNADADFSFRVGGTPYKFSEVDDLTPAFGIAVEKDVIALDVSNVTPQRVLDRLFVGTVTLPDDLKQDYYFTLEVTAANGETVAINFRAFASVTGVELKPDNEGVLYF